MTRAAMMGGGIVGHNGRGVDRGWRNTLALFCPRELSELDLSHLGHDKVGLAIGAADVVAVELVRRIRSEAMA